MAEINENNVLGSKGRLARQYAKFVKNVWTGITDTFSPSTLKSAVAQI